MRAAVRLADRAYTAWIRLYPREFRADFAEEMQTVFREGTRDADAQGALASFILRELRDAPRALVSAHWSNGLKRLREALEHIHAAASPSDLPPPPPDGRRSWRQAGLELGLFLSAGLILVAVTYLPVAGAPAGWQRDLGLLGQMILPVTLPIGLLGLARGLPRWAYPWVGLWLSYNVLTAQQAGSLPFLAVMLLTSGLLAAIAVATDPRRVPLPVLVRRLAQSLQLDWTRLSFGLYGALPLAIIAAFDDAHADNRTPYLAASAALMIAGALLYSRSRRSLAQIAALLGGMSLVLWTAWLDKAAFAGGLAGWIAAPRPGAEDLAWMMALWSSWSALLLAPALLAVAGRASRPRRAAP